MNSIFLAHSSNNKRFARRLAEDLKFFSVKVWIDEAELQVGDSLIGRIEDAIEKVDYLIVVLSPASVCSEWVKKEVDLAMTKEIKGKLIKVLPILWKPCPIPGFLLGKVYLDFTASSKYERNLHHLIRKITGREEAELRIEKFNKSIKSSSVGLKINKNFVTNYLKEMTDSDKRIDKYILNQVVAGELSYEDLSWEEKAVYVNCNIPNSVVGYQGDEWGGTILTFREMKALFCLTDERYLALTPTGKLLLETLDIMVEDTIFGPYK